MRNFIITSSFFIITLLTYGQVNLEDGLVAYYPFNANADDYSVFENHGQLSSFVDRTTDKFNVPYAAYEFDNRDDIITVPDASQIDFLNDFTINVWAYPREVDSYSLVRKGDDYLIVLSGIGNSIFRIETEDGTFSVEITSGYTFDEWQMFTGIRSGNEMYFFRNNILIGQNTLTGTNIVNDGALLIGNRTPTFDEILPRKIDEVRLYNRAINTEEINALYQFQVDCPLGSVIINSQSDLDSYTQNFPDCTSLPSGLLINASDITDLSPFSELLSIFGDLIIDSNPNLTTLTGFEDLLEIFDGDFRVLNNNSLISLGEFARGVTLENNVFEVTNNSSLLDIAGFDTVRLPSAFIVKDNEVLSSLIGITLNATDSINISNNNSLINLVGINSLDEVGVFYIQNNNNLQSLLGFPSSSLGILEGLHIKNNVQLTDISDITIFPVDANGILEITNNSNLSVCNVFYICNNLNEFDEIYISNNAFGCNSIEELITNCELELNHIIGNIKYDFNNDGCDTDDFKIEGALVEISNGTETFTASSNFNGVFSTFIDATGSFDVFVIEESLSPYFQVNPINEVITFSGFSNSETVDFCLTATETINDLKITILALNEARPGFDTDYQIIYENIGTTVLSGEVTLEFDDTRQSFLNAIPSQDGISANIITWNYADLLPFESRSINVSYNTLAPPTNEDGDVLVFEATINPVSGDENSIDNVYHFEQIIVNSQDPNVKQVMQGAEIYEVEIGNYLDYIVRFQNVGTASAINVRVDDVLSNKLNWNTLRPLSSSHSYRVEILDGNQVSFIFDDINLPAEADDPEGSNGYIAFQVKTKSDLLLGDTVTNTANIYFDFNDAVITNTVSTQVVENLGITDTNLEAKISLIPNPVSETLNISFSENISFQKAKVYSILGEKIIETTEQQIDLSNFTSGIYFVEVATSQGSITKKVVKK